MLQPTSSFGRARMRAARLGDGALRRIYCYGGTDMTDAPILRDAVRAILLTPAREVLLMRVVPPDGSTVFWITPGGGLDAGEEAEVGLRRELREELDLHAFEVGPLVFRRDHTFDWDGRRYRQKERLYVVHVERFEPRINDLDEARTIERMHWWPVDELRSMSERVTPVELAKIVGTYLARRDAGAEAFAEWEVGSKLLVD